METEEIQHQLQKNLESTLQEIVDLDAHIEMLKVCVKPRPFKQNNSDPAPTVDFANSGPGQNPTYKYSN